MVDLFALLNDDALGQLFCGKADSGSSDFFAPSANTPPLYYQTASLAVGSSQTGLDHQGQNADGTVRQISLGQLVLGMCSVSIALPLNSARAAF